MHTQADKADAGKTNPLILHKDLAKALLVVQRVLDYGLQKYERKSWVRVEHDAWDAAARRHLQQLDLGEILDDESGLHHRAHAIAGQIIMLQKEIEDSLGVDWLSYNKPPQDHKS